MTNARRERWSVASGFNGPGSCERTPDGFRLRFGGGQKPDFYVVRGPGGEEVHFGHDEAEAAKLMADERNRFEAQGPLDPAFADRRNRLIELAPDFGGIYYEGPSAARWPVRPGRYLVRDGGVGWHPMEVDLLAEDLKALREILAKEERDIWQVIDLDTGDEVPFSREITVEVGSAAP